MRLWWWCAVGALGASACGPVASAGCVEGERQYCPCLDGNRGIQVCQSGGDAWGECSCGSEPSAPANGSTSTPDAGAPPAAVESTYSRCVNDPSACTAECGDLTADPLNCGDCGRVCSSGTCEGGDCVLRVFLTLETFDGNLGGLAGADAACQSEARAAGLSGTYRAWLSDSTAWAGTRVTHTAARYVRIDGQTVASGWGDLTDGDLDAAIAVTVAGTVGSASTTTVYTNTNVDGGPSSTTDTCNDWTSDAGMNVYVGDSAYQNFWWTGDGHSIAYCNYPAAKLYCFEQ
jgi:hypothetical protein